MTLRPVILLGEAWGANEARISAAFVGSSGVELLKQLHAAKALELTAADNDHIRRFYRFNDPTHIDRIWAAHPDFIRLNVFPVHPPGNDLAHFCGPKSQAIPGYPKLGKGYVRQDCAHHLSDLAATLDRLDPNLIVCLGATPLWALTGFTAIKKLRGTTLLSTHTIAGFKLLPTYHPAFVLRDMRLRPITITDLGLIPAERLTPDIRRTEREIWIEPSVDDIRTFFDRHIRPDGLLSIDIETVGNRITCIGFAPSAQLGIVIPFDDERSRGRNYWANSQDEHDAWAIIRRALGDASIPKLFQNGLYDIAFLWRSMQIPVLGALHDTMLLHHALQPEMIKDLGFLGSVYANESAWKYEHKRKGTTIKRGA